MMISLTSLVNEKLNNEGNEIEDVVNNMKNRYAPD